jgi:serine/threonine protein kinase
MDIKPENIMLKKRNESQIKIIDFGLSRIILPSAQVKEMVSYYELGMSNSLATGWNA